MDFDTAFLWTSMLSGLSFIGQLKDRPQGPHGGVLCWLPPFVAEVLHDSGVIKAYFYRTNPSQKEEARKANASPLESEDILRLDRVSLLVKRDDKLMRMPLKLGGGSFSCPWRDNAEPTKIAVEIHTLGRVFKSGWVDFPQAAGLAAGTTLPEC